MNKRKIVLLALVLLIITILLMACSQKNISQENTSLEQQKTSVQITLKGDGIEGELTYSMDQLHSLPDGEFAHIYSTINNWPTKKTYAASGVKVTSILKNTGVLESMKSITFRSDDGYQCVLTKDQFDQKRYYFLHLDIDSSQDAEPVEVIIADRYKEDSSDLSEIQAETPCLIFGQSNVFEHNNPAYVSNVSEIIVSSEPCEKWEPATTFPSEGIIAAGEKVKLQHPKIGVVKLFYTLDGTDPTEESTMYNPSTYQPELNVPIGISGDTVIKVLAAGYGKENSEITTYHFKVSK